MSLQLFHAVDHEELDRARGVGELQAELLFHGGFERPHVAGGPAQRNVVPVADSGFVDDGPVDDLTKRGDKTRDVSVGKLRRAVAESRFAGPSRTGSQLVRCVVETRQDVDRGVFLLARASRWKRWASAFWKSGWKVSGSPEISAVIAYRVLPIHSGPRTRYSGTP